MKKIAIFLTIILSVILLGLTIKGQIGNPIYYQSQFDTRVEGPFESSNSTARYALTKAIVDDHTFFLSKSLAQFASPDVVDHNGKFISIFTPGVSFISIPFYALGKVLGFPQLFTYMTTLIFAVANMLLVMRLSKKLGANHFASILSGFLFLFATNAFPYAHSLTQHHFSVTVVLLSIFNAISERTLLNDIALGGLFGISALFDIPNLILLMPVMIYAGIKHFSFQKHILSIKLTFIGMLIGLLPFIGLFAYYNFQTAGSYTKLAQFIGRSTAFDVPNPDTKAKQPKPAQHKKTNENSFPFQTRLQLSGLYTLVISNERSWAFYSPIVLIGIIGMFFSYQRRETKTLATICIAVALTDLLLYSMFGDPWGGWSFGPRYLIPAAAILTSGIGVAIERLKQNIVFTPVFFIVAIYSLAVSTIAVMTTSAIPPKGEAIHLATPLPYTYQYNLGFIAKNQSSSLFYNMFLAHYLNLNIFVITYIVGLILILTTLFFFSFVETKGEKA